MSEALYLYRDKTAGMEPVDDARWSGALRIGRRHHARESHCAAHVDVLFPRSYNARCNKQNTVIRFPLLTSVYPKVSGLIHNEIYAYL